MRARARRVVDQADTARFQVRQGRVDVLDPRMFADLVHGGIGQAEIDHRAELDQETPIRGAAAGRKFGLDAGLLADRGYDDVVKLARRRQEGLARDAGANGGARRLPGRNVLYHLHQVGSVLEVVEADV